MLIRVPGKTFLLGEYAVLNGSPALIACSSPYFELHVTNTPSTQYPFHPESPAGKLIYDHHALFSEKTLRWVCPYVGGGFGESTAAFLACYEMIYGHPSNLDALNKLYQCYLTYAYNNKGIPPSGADLIAQTQNNTLVYIQKSDSHITAVETFSWPFTNYRLFLMKTAHKIPTHTHLESLNNLPDTTYLSELTQRGYKALCENNPTDFIHCINNYATELQRLRLTLKNTQEILITLNKNTHCLAAKGCGALGADVIAVVITVRPVY